MSVMYLRCFDLGLTSITFRKRCETVEARLAKDQVAVDSGVGSQSFGKVLDAWDHMSVLFID